MTLPGRNPGSPTHQLCDLEQANDLLMPQFLYPSNGSSNIISGSCLRGSRRLCSGRPSGQPPSPPPRRRFLPRGASSRCPAAGGGNSHPCNWRPACEILRAGPRPLPAPGPWAPASQRGLIACLLDQRTEEQTRAPLGTDRRAGDRG